MSDLRKILPHGEQKKLAKKFNISTSLVNLVLKGDRKGHENIRNEAIRIAEKVQLKKAEEQERIRRIEKMASK